VINTQSVGVKLFTLIFTQKANTKSLFQLSLEIPPRRSNHKENLKPFCAAQTIINRGEPKGVTFLNLRGNILMLNTGDTNSAAAAAAACTVDPCS
jgi:hypothetical protein